MKKLKRSILITTVFLFLLFTSIINTLLFPTKLSSRPVYKVDSIINMADSMEITLPDAYLIDQNIVAYFSIEKEAFTFIEDLTTENMQPTQDTQYYAVGNLNGFVKYQKNGEMFQFFSVNGMLLNEITCKESYPYVTEESPVVYAVKNNGCGLSSFYFNGEPLLREYSGNSLICSISCSENLDTAISKADGDSLLLDKNGKLLFTCEQKSPAVRIAKTSYFSPENNYFSEISGLFPELLTIYKTDSDTPIMQFKTGSNLRYSPKLKIQNGIVYYETNNTLELYSIKKQKKCSLPFRGGLKDFKISSTNEIILLSEKDSMNYVYIYNNEGICSFYQESYCDISNLRIYNETTFYFKSDKDIFVLRRKMLS